jgi:tripartite-type tricarboxylate transporter receptor subunit TctC
VPYKGSSQALTDLLAGNIDVTSSNAVVAPPLIRAGRVRALVTGGPSRHPALPDVPTFAEAGLPGYEPSDWKAVLGPKDIPPEVVARLNAEVNAIVKEKEFAAVLEADGSMAIGGTPAQLLALIKSDMERWRALVRDRQIKIE